MLRLTLKRIPAAHLATAIANLVVISVFLPDSAAAATFPATFTLDTGQSNLNVSLATAIAPLGDADFPSVEGLAEADIEQNGILPPASNFTNVVGAIVLGDTTVSTVLGAIGLNDITIDFGPGPGPYLGNGLNPGIIDLGGLPLSITSGTITLGTTTTLTDFSVTPLITSLPFPTLVAFEETLGPPSYALSLTMPVSVQETAVVPELGNLEVSFALAGSLMFGGEMSVPEPSGLWLGAASLLGFVAMAYRRGRTAGGLRDGARTTGFLEQTIRLVRNATTKASGLHGTSKIKDLCLRHEFDCRDLR